MNTALAATPAAVPMNLRMLRARIVDQLSGLIPRILISSEVQVEGGRVFGVPEGEIDTVELFPDDDASWAIFEAFNGSTTIGENAQSVARGVSADRGAGSC